MRDRLRLELRPEEYRDRVAAERQATLRELLAILRSARERGADWYYGVLELAERREGYRATYRAAGRLIPDVVATSLEPDPDSPFQPPASARREPEPVQGSLFT